MINKFSNGGKVLILAVFATLLASQAFAGFGGVSSYAGSFTRTINPVFAGDFQRGPSITTEKASYFASDSVLISGEGFKRYERVRFAVGVESKDGSSGLVIGQWDVYADGKGRISTTWDIPGDGGSFTVTATGDASGLTAKTTVTTDNLNEAANLDQCANGAIGSETLCNTSVEWVNGNLNSNKAHWVEGQYVPYRMSLTGLSAGAGQTLTIEWDTTKQGKHATDYIGTFNATEALTDPCVGLTCGAASTFPIPVDPQAVNQQMGNMTIYGGTITNMSAYTTSGTYAGDSSTRITITFTASGANVVFAWAGHIASRVDWGAGSSATAIPGSPYHMRLIELNGSGGNQDRALSADAVTLPANITITKVASPISDTAFGFTTDIPGSGGAFSLTDDGTGTNDSVTYMVTASDGFGSYFVTESNPSPYQLVGLSCMVTTELGFTAGSESTSLGTRTATLGVLEGNDYDCTFTNDFTTAAEATVTGRVYDPNGKPLAYAWVSGTDGNGNTSYARTNMFGYYTIRELEAGTSLFMAVAHKSYNFPSSFVTLNEEVTTVDFYGSPR